MKTALMTGWSGTDFALIACETVPLMHRYALRHGMNFFCESLNGQRPPSWMKIPLLLNALVEHGSVLWIDADVVIEQGDVNILDSVPSGSWQAMVRHTTYCGDVPNCGVWFLSPEMIPILGEAWNSGKNIHRFWWEQGTILELMGYVLRDRFPITKLENPTPLYDHTAFLESTWNHHPADKFKVEKPRFRHVTQYDNRLEAVRMFANAAKQALQVG